MKWESFSEVAFYSMKGVLPLWKDASTDTVRAMTRILYDLVFSCGKPNKTGYMSSAAMSAQRSKNKTCSDHCLSPQFVARMVYDNPDIWLEDFEKFKSLFYDCCLTILVTSKENNELSKLTRNKDGVFTVSVPTHKKYEHLGIQLFHKDKGYVDNVLEGLVPKELVEYEKQYLVS
tara:strand:- start:228 stop:752 length:525 start_codon:yes stop_codon:yes gene_type:complete